MTSQRGVASVEVAGAILDALRGSAGPVGLTELASITGLPPPRLHHYLVSLVRIGLVGRDVVTHKYALGSFALELGLVVADSLDLQHLSAKWLRRLSAETGESSFFAIGSTRGALIVRWEQGSRPLTVHARLGTVMPILKSATGLVWSAYDSRSSQAALESELRRIDPVSREGMRQARRTEAAKVRLSGMANALGSMIPNVNAFSCPVIGQSGSLAGMLTVLGLGSYFDADLDGKTAKGLRICANAFGQTLP